MKPLQSFLVLFLAQRNIKPGSKALFFGGAVDFFDSPEMFLPHEPTRGLLIQAEINLLGEHHTLSLVPKALVVEVLVVLDDRTPHFAVAKEISQMQ